jgi:hypothetical protein
MNAVQLLAVTIVSIFLVSCSPNAKTPPKAVKGVLDLREWNFTSTPITGLKNEESEEKSIVTALGNINLDGEWEFYWKEFPSGENLELPEIRKNIWKYRRPGMDIL